MNDTFIASALNKLNNELLNLVNLWNFEKMSCANLHPSNIPRKSCACEHHRHQKARKTCGRCKSKTRNRQKSSEKAQLSTADESMAGEPHVDEPGAVENAYRNPKIKIGALQKELDEEKNHINELNEKLQKIQQENESLKSTKDELTKQMACLQDEIQQLRGENKSVKCECDSLKSKLKFAENREVKRASELTEEVQTMRIIVKDKEDLLNNEKTKFNLLIKDLTDTVIQQKRKITELMNVCSTQKSQIVRQAETEEKFTAKCCECDEIQEELENLKVSLNEEAKAANNFKKEMEMCKKNCECELLLKDKIIGDQSITIKRLKNVLHDNEKIAKQAARDYEMLIDNLYSVKQENTELKMILPQITENVTIQNPKELKRCQRCLHLEHKITSIEQQKQKALIAADYATKKLCQTTGAYQTSIKLEKQQHKFLGSIIEQKDEEIECLKKEIQHLTLYT